MRGIAGAAQADAQGNLRVEVTLAPDDSPVDGVTREGRLHLGFVTVGGEDVFAG